MTLPKDEHCALCAERKRFEITHGVGQVVGECPFDHPDHAPEWLRKRCQLYKKAAIAVAAIPGKGGGTDW